MSACGDILHAETFYKRSNRRNGLKKCPTTRVNPGGNEYDPRRDSYERIFQEATKSSFTGYFGIQLLLPVRAYKLE